MHQREKRVPAVSADVAVGATADLALDDLAADVPLGTIGVEWYLRSIEYHQQLGFIGMQPLEQAVEGGEAGAAAEDPVEPCAHFTATS